MLDFVTRVERFVNGRVFALVHAAPSEFVSRHQWLNIAIALASKLTRKRVKVNGPHS